MTKKIYDKSCLQCVFSLCGICDKCHWRVNQYNCRCCNGTGMKTHKNEQWKKWKNSK